MPADGGGVTITVFDMRENPHLQFPPPVEPFALLHAEQPPTHFYRYLYDMIGKERGWTARRGISEAALTEMLEHPDVELYVLYARGVPAGLCELDFRERPEARIAYFGVSPDFVGRGFGKYLLVQAITMAWRRDIERLTIRASELDPTATMPLLQKCGFSPCAQETVGVDHTGW